MNDFGIFFPLGLEHIIDKGAIDHIAFVVVLCLRYIWTDWKKLLALVTAFTIGHSITLALSTLNIINIPTRWSEFFIAITILITAMNNLAVRDFQFKKKYPLIYFYALGFGLIHGLGFSTALKSMLGQNQSISIQLFAFNLGLEAGQLLIVFLVLFISFVLVSLLNVNRRDYILFISGCIAALAIQMALERLPVKHTNNDEKIVIIHSGYGCNICRNCAGYPQQPGV